jgi:GNAT superfamily N-acetyltransferase
MGSLTLYAALNSTLMSITAKYHDLLGDRYSDSDLTDRSLDQSRLQKLNASYEDGRYDQIEERWELMVFCVHPSFQRRGAGSMLLEKGCQIADSEGVPAVVDSSSAGERTYSKHGFEKFKWVDFSHLEAEVVGCPQISFWSMVRTAKVS